MSDNLSPEKMEKNLKTSIRSAASTIVNHLNCLHDDSFLEHDCQSFLCSIERYLFARTKNKAFFKKNGCWGIFLFFYWSSRVKIMLFIGNTFSRKSNKPHFSKYLINKVIYLKCNQCESVTVLQFPPVLRPIAIRLLLQIKTTVMIFVFCNELLLCLRQ